MESLEQYIARRVRESMPAVRQYAERGGDIGIVQIHRATRCGFGIARRCIEELQKDGVEVTACKVLS